MTLPIEIRNEKELDTLMTTPSPKLIAFFKELKGDIMILGIGGKMGITLGGLAVNAAKAAGVKKKIIGVSRFSDPQAKKNVENFGVETIACDLLDADSVKNLPLVDNIIFMAGKKFGTQNEEELTWAMNTIVPANVAKHFNKSNIVAFSTGCVYPLMTVLSSGADETVTPEPIGDYSQSALGRERVFEYYARYKETKVCLYRLNYAIDLRYGVLRDIGEKVFNNQAVDIKSSHVNVIWQGDANTQALLCLGQCTSPATKMNITGPETLSVKWIAKEFATIFNKEATFSGTPNETMYLNNSAKASELFGYPAVTPKTMVRWIANWIISGGKSLNKPTHFEVTSGRY